MRWVRLESMHLSIPSEWEELLGDPESYLAVSKEHPLSADPWAALVRSTLTVGLVPKSEGEGLVEHHAHVVRRHAASDQYGRIWDLTWGQTPNGYWYRTHVASGMAEEEPFLTSRWIVELSGQFADVTVACSPAEIELGHSLAEQVVKSLTPAEGEPPGWHVESVPVPPAEAVDHSYVDAIDYARGSEGFYGIESVKWIFGDSYTFTWPAEPQIVPEGEAAFPPQFEQLQDIQPDLTVTGQFRGEVSRAKIWIRGEDALAELGPSHQDIVRGRPEHHHYFQVKLPTVPLLLASWGSGMPEWSGMGAQEYLDDEFFGRATGKDGVQPAPGLEPEWRVEIYTGHWAGYGAQSPHTSEYCMWIVPEQRAPYLMYLTPRNDHFLLEPVGYLRLITALMRVVRAVADGKEAASSPQRRESFVSWLRRKF